MFGRAAITLGIGPLDRSLRGGTCIRQVDTRRVEMYQLFKDFDRSTAYTRVVTPSQFGRILATLRVAVDPEDHRLLCRKFAVDPGATTGDINYPAFVQCVDRVFVNYTVDRLKQYDCAPACPKVHADYILRES